MRQRSLLSWLLGRRRQWAAMLGIVVMIAGLLPAHATIAPVPVAHLQVSILADQPGDGYDQLDATAGHACTHCACKVVGLPSEAWQGPASVVYCALFVLTPPHALRPSATPPPAEPPRA